MKKYILCLAICLITFGACQKAPIRQNVEYHEMNSQKKDIKPEFVAVGDAIGEMKDIVEDGHYLNFIFNGNYLYPEIDNIYSYQGKLRKDDNFKNYMEVIKPMWTNYPADDSAFEIEYYEGHEDDYGNRRQYKIAKNINDSGDLIAYYEIENNGHIGFNDENYDQYLDFEELVDSYSIAWNEKVDDSVGYELEDGYCSVNEAIDYINNQFVKGFSKLDNDLFTYRVAYVSVVKNKKSEKYNYKFFVGRYLNGVLLDTVNVFCNNSIVESEKKDVAIEGTRITCIMKKKKQLNCFINDYICDFFNPNEYNKIVSFRSALELAQDKYAIGTLKVDKCGLIYLMIYDVDINKVAVNPYIRELRPFWIVSNDEFSDEVGNCHLMGNREVHGQTYLIDAINGEVYNYDETSMGP